MTIAIRVRASHKAGLGHWVRQTHLAKALAARGHEVHLFPDAGSSLDLIPVTGLKNIPVNDENHFLEALSDKTSLLVLDVQNTTGQQVQGARRKAEFVAGFEDLGAGRDFLDVLIDCNLAESEKAKLPESVQCLFGPEYSLLHPDFKQAATRPRTFKEGITTLLITMGGTDPNRMTRPLAEAAKTALPSARISILWGPGFSNPEDRQALEDNLSFSLIPPVDNLSELLSSHDAVLCAGGVTLHEALASGTPAFVIAQVPHQTDKARALETLGAARYLGRHGDWTQPSLHEALSSSPEILSQMSTRGQALIDGRGLERIVEVLLPLAAS